MHSIRFGLAAIASIGAFSAAPLAQASVVDAKIGTLNTEVHVAAWNGFREPYLTDSEFDDAIAFVTLSSLSSSASGRVSGAHASSFLALDARAEWASPDHGTATLNTLSSVFYDGTNIVDQGQAEYTANARSGDLPPFGSQRPTPFWQYNFTPNVDSFFSVDVAKSGNLPANINNLAQYDGQFYLLINGVFSSGSLSNGDHFIYNLNAGQKYTFGLDPYLREIYDGNIQTFDDQNFSAFTLTFDITAAAIDPGGGGGSGGGVPEPSAWLLMLSGFAAAGYALRGERSAERRRLA